jgi:hypothetical protein
MSGIPMRKNVTIGFSPAEFMRLQGAAAAARMPVASYLKWLLQGSPVDGMTRSTSLILERLDGINVTIARLSGAQGPQPVPARVSRVAPRDVIQTRLRARGLPSSTIQQVNAVLDDLEAGR